MKMVLRTTMISKYSLLLVCSVSRICRRGTIGTIEWSGTSIYLKCFCGAILGSNIYNNIIIKKIVIKIEGK